MSTYFLALISGKVALLSVLVAGLIGLVRFRSLLPDRRYLALLAGFDVLMELTIRALVPVFHLKSNLFMIPLIAIGEVALLLLAFREALQSVVFNQLILWVLLSFSFYALLDSWTELRRVHYAADVQITADLLQLSLAMLYFWKLLSELQVERLRHDPFFWVSVGLVGYVLGDLLIMLFSNYSLVHYSRQLQLIIMSIVRPWFLTALYCSYSLALWLRPQKSNLYSS